MSASMASGGMDTLPHNGAVITLLAVTGLTHRQAYKDIFAITAIKTDAQPRGLPLPLGGVRVLDLGQVFQGPYASFLMATAGAEAP